MSINPNAVYEYLQGLQNRIVEINTTVSQDQVIATLSERGFTADPA